MPRELLRLHHAKVRRDGRIICDIDDFVIYDGEQVVVLGPNGAGKSTLIKLITREVMPLWREDPPLLFHGDRRCPLDVINRTVGVVSSSYAEKMTRHMRVIEAVLGGFFGSVGVPVHKKVSTSQIKRAQQALDELGILDLAERDMLTLSTGQARRALIARALVDAPEVLVFDEPCTGLDPEATWNLRQSLSALARSGRTILLVTHDVGDIICDFDRVVMLKDAHIVADGKKRDLLTTERLRDLFGVPVTLTENEGHYALY